MKRNSKTVLVVLIGLLTVFLMTACNSSTFSIVTNEDFETEVEATNCDEQSGMGYVELKEGELFTVDAEIESDEGEFVVKVYKSEEATGEESADEIMPSGDPLGVTTMKATGTATVDYEPGEYTVVVETAGGVTGTLKIYGAPAK